MSRPSHCGDGGPYCDLGRGTYKCLDLGPCGQSFRHCSHATILFDVCGWLVFVFLYAAPIQYEMNQWYTNGKLPLQHSTHTTKRYKESHFRTSGMDHKIYLMRFAQIDFKCAPITDKQTKDNTTKWWLFTLPARFFFTGKRERDPKITWRIYIKVN